MKENKNITSIFDNCHETASQEIFLRSCGFAQRGVPPDSDPSVGISSPLNDGIGSHPEKDDVIASDLVESHAIRFVSPPESVDTVDVDEDAADRTVPVESKVDEEVGEKLESPANKLKIPLRDVVKAIVMNSRNIDEEDKEIQKTSCVQILVKKGFKFP